jgi:hypothetical protein
MALSAANIVSLSYTFLANRHMTSEFVMQRSISSFSRASTISSALITPSVIAWSIE